jgi:parallel beta-helix repeat protein
MEGKSNTTYSPHGNGGLSILWILTMLFFSFPAWSGTYYLRADGTANNKASATGCDSKSTAMSASRHDNQSFDPGDVIVLCSQGGVFRSTLMPRSSGNNGSPIIYDGKGTAVVAASDLVTGWTNDGGNVYRASVSKRPQQVFINGAFGDRRDNKNQLSEDRDWYWQSNTLYLYSQSGDPDTAYTNPGIEAGARDVAFDIGYFDWVTIQGITARHANWSGFKVYGPGSNITVRNNVAEWNWNGGIDFNGNENYSDIVIEDNIARYNGEGGILLLGSGRNSTIRRNTCYENGKFQSERDFIEFDHQWTFGIKLWEGGSGQEGNQIYENRSYNNGRGNPGDQQGQGVGIWIDGVPGNPGNPIVIRHNLVYDNTGNGIFIEISSNTVTHHNVVHNNATNTGGWREWVPGNIVIDARGNMSSNNNKIYNNTSYGGKYGIKVVTYEQSGCKVNNNIVKNNIAINASEHNLYARFGGDNDGSNGTGNVYQYNNFGQQSKDFIQWGGTAYDTYSTWKSAYGSNTYSITGDPELAGSTRNTLFLTEQSPCRDAGQDMDYDYRMALESSSSWPNSVDTTDENQHGSSWDVGAYCFMLSGNSPPEIYSSDFDSGNLDGWTVVN